MRFFYFLFLFCCLQSLTAQSYDALVSVNPTFVDEINLNTLTKNQLAIITPFAKSIILNPEQKKLINDRIVTKLQLVYTKYRLVNLFNQKSLNRKRLTELDKLLPNLFKNRYWNYELISQTNGNSPEVCNKMFHGFILTFRPKSDASTQKQEANYLEKVTKELVKADSSSPKKIMDIKTHWNNTTGYVHDTIWIKDTIKLVPLPDFLKTPSYTQDSTVLKILNRNTNWKNYLFVVDATGSMSPYISQVFNWLIKSDKKEANGFVFFNDGDGKSDNRKETLNTRGIYVSKEKSIVDLNKLVKKCIKNGNGGDTKENNIEAIIEGLKYYPKTNEIILVADNYANMRDYAFISKIKIPVHIILCGAENRINTQYLNFAYQTKGSVHTINSDVYDLQNHTEGQHFFIDDKEYMFKKDKFYAIYGLEDKYR